MRPLLIFLVSFDCKSGSPKCTCFLMVHFTSLAKSLTQMSRSRLAMIIRTLAWAPQTYVCDWPLIITSSQSHPEATIPSFTLLLPCILQTWKLRPKSLKDIQDHQANQWQSQALNSGLLTSIVLFTNMYESLGHPGFLGSTLPQRFQAFAPLTPGVSE